MIRDQRGFTLVEVLVVSVILVFVLAGAYAFYTFGQKLFYSGARQVDLHNSLRLAAERINRELRFADALTLLDEDWEPPETAGEYSYIYYDADSRRVMLLDDESGPRSLSDQVVSAITFTAEGKILLYTIQGERRSKMFTLDSSVKPMNLDGSIGGAAGSRALQFSLPSAP